VTHLEPEPTEVIEQKPTIAKAVVAVSGALGAAIATAVSDGHVTAVEIVLAVLLAVGAGAAVWATTNKPSGS
jgi:zinc transporter ZupT